MQMPKLEFTMQNKQLESHQFQSMAVVMKPGSTNKLRKSLLITAVIIVAMMFLPWTQNIKGEGLLTSLRPDQRPQTIQSIIPGRIEKWYVREGERVQKGDTIMQISEVKDDYFDPNLLLNTKDQITNKEASVDGYMKKISALDRQIDAMSEGVRLKLLQQENKVKQSALKVQSDSVEYSVFASNAKIALDQYNRFLELFTKGLKSETELEQREIAMQTARSKEVESMNKLSIARQEYTNANTELSSIKQDFRDKISKAESEKFSTLSTLYDTEAQVTKLQSQFAGYTERLGNYFITSPVDGFITRAIQSGVGETLKEGAELMTIMPANYELAVEMYIKPMDYPLIQQGQKVRFIFDGWPAFVFSGWPGASSGTYGGVVVAIDNFTNAKGEYRLLVAPDKEDVPWPSGIRVGGGARGFALLNNVFVGYELWRQFNGFPPNFYDAHKPEEVKK